MTIPDDELGLVAWLIQHLDSLKIHREDRAFEGVLVTGLDFDSIVRQLQRFNLEVASDEGTGNIEGHLPRNYFETMADLLEVPRNRMERLESFYIRDLDILVRPNTPSPSLPPLVRHYFQATILFDALLRVADHHCGIAADKTGIFLLPSGKIEIRCDYGVDDLTELQGLDDFEREFMASETQATQKKMIIKTALGDIFSGSSRVPFSSVLSQYTALVDKVRAGYELYVAEFSFQKVKEAIEKEKLDAMLKLNKVFSDIQNQLLAIPVALVLVGGQMQESSGFSPKNLLIWLGALVFAVLMDLLIRNQRHTLKAVKEEIDQQRKQLEAHYQSLMDRFTAAYGEVEKRYLHQSRLIMTVDALVSLSFGVTSLMLLWYSNTWG